jgi:hypothetical protein
MTQREPSGLYVYQPLAPTKANPEPKIVAGIEYFWVGDEEDSQCARCGSSTYAVGCWNCGGEGFLEDEDDWEGDPDGRRCDICGGDGGWQRCCSSREFCDAHPMPGREAIKSSARDSES